MLSLEIFFLINLLIAVLLVIYPLFLKGRRLDTSKRVGLMVIGVAYGVIVGVAYSQINVPSAFVQSGPGQDTWVASSYGNPQAAKRLGATDHRG